MSDEIKIIRKTFHSYVILEKLHISKKEIIEKFESIEKFRLLMPFLTEDTQNFIKNYKVEKTNVDFFTQKLNSGYSVEYDLFDGEKILTKNNMSFEDSNTQGGENDKSIQINKKNNNSIGLDLITKMFLENIKK